MNIRPPPPIIELAAPLTSLEKKLSLSCNKVIDEANRLATSYFNKSGSVCT
jgi:hypothetical protein